MPQRVTQRAIRTVLLVLLFFSTVPAASPEEGARSGGLNRLAGERSPYLRQHASNPVDWYPWGPEALALAKRLDKPIFLSIGYAACHWCHVMEHESFQHGETARLLNEAFVNVKVDREERPDLDRLYMNAVLALAGRGGWPMTVILTPEGKPFFGGTYFRRAALQRLVRSVSRDWRLRRAVQERTAERVAAQMRVAAAGPRAPATGLNDAQLIANMRSSLASAFDSRYGGYASRKKFPPHGALLFFTGEGGPFADASDAAMLRRTVDAMDEGGFHDQVGGGFHRYTVDDHWLVPHFEKMLYDNALLVCAYARMYGRTKQPRDRRTAERALAWIERDLKRPGGGYASSLDADTNGHEGLTYVWTLGQLRSALPGPGYGFATAALGATRRGNFSEGLFDSARGRNILYLPRPLSQTASSYGLPEARIVARMDGVLDRLLRVRAQRPQPRLDEKVITAWNGMLLSALALSGRYFEDRGHLERARALARFLLTESRREDGALLRFPRDSGVPIMGFAEDSVHLINGLLDLSAATGEVTWREAATDLGRRLLSGFEDRAVGGFFDSSHRGHETLIARGKAVADNPIPSDNGMAALVCLRLYGVTGEASFRRAANRTLALYRPAMAQRTMVRSSATLFRALAERLTQERTGGGPQVGITLRVRQDVVQVEVLPTRASVRAGRSLQLRVRVQVDRGWHVNASGPSGPGLTPTALSLRPGATALLAAVRYPEPVRRSLRAGSPALDLYEGSFEIHATLAVPARARPGRLLVPLLLSLQPCDASICKDAQQIRLDVAVTVTSP